jgi:hypothetical protein
MATESGKRIELTRMLLKAKGKRGRNWTYV